MECDTSSPRLLLGLQLGQVRVQGGQAVGGRPVPAPAARQAEPLHLQLPHLPAECKAAYIDFMLSCNLDRYAPIARLNVCICMCSAGRGMMIV